MLVAVVKNGKIRSLSATGANGRALRVSTIREVAHPRPGTTVGDKVTCWVCIKHPAGEVFYEIDCDKVPKPKVAVQ
jgi:hypothetical protein